MRVNELDFSFNPDDNGGEEFSLTTVGNVDVQGNISYNHTLSLMSYGNVASFSLGGDLITPEILRDLANQMDKFQATFALQAITK